MSKNTDNRERRAYGKVTSDSYLLTFDTNEDNEVNARKIAQRLASKRKLKSVLISMLCAIHDAEQELGKEVDISEFTARFVRGLAMGMPVYGQLPITAEVSPDLLQSEWLGTVDHVDPDEVRETLQLKMGNLLDDDDDF
jgi:hypothetical protein